MAPSELVLHSSPRATRSQSISSDRPSLTGYGGLLSPPASTLPDPAFIAASAASQIVTNDHDSQADAWFDQHGIEPSGETALVAVPALKLVNSFLDQLLFNFLSISKSTSLTSLRPAVSEVLKPKLAKDAINGADQELQEYLGGGEDEELLAFHNGIEPSSDWDLELVWKRTRLRCMVYSSLGDMEEEDEDYYTEQEQLDGPPGSNNRFSNNPGVVSPAVAIFLTSILEFMGEQVLVVAGQAAYHRLRAKHEKEERDGTSTPAGIADRIVVEESDMERVALDRTLGRLWRGWKKRIRSPTASVSVTRSFSRESMRSLQPQPINQDASNEMEDITKKDPRRPSLAAVLAEYEYAATIALPISADDVREIEIPGLALQRGGEEEATEEEDPVVLLPRPKSFMIFRTPETQTPMSSQLQTPRSRKRANSLPSPAPTPYTSPARRQKSSEDSLDKNSVHDLEVDTPGESAAESDSWTENRDHDENEPEEENKTTIAGLIAGTAAIGTTAVSGMVAALNGKDPQTATDDAEEESNEEPQIMTSSRVSLSSQISPDGLKALSRHSSVQSHSARSLRLIDVASPKSPGRSRHGSVDAADYVTGRPIVISRPSSIHSQISDSQTPRVSSPILRGSSSSPIARNGSSLSTSYIRNSAGDSISEVEEKEANENESGPATAVPADLTAAVQGVDANPSPSPSSHQFAVDSSPNHVAQKHSGFILSAPPATRIAQATALSKVDQPAPPDANLGVISPSRTLGVENDVPPLTPLREMMEGAPGTSDEASSIAPSNDGHSLSENGISGHSPSVSASTVPYSQRTARAQPVSVTRSSPPRSSREEAARKVMAEPLPKAHRATHASGSSSSSASHKVKPVRTSEEDAPNTFEDKGRSFEQLIRSDQTIQYTLTPQNMRNIEAPESPRHAAPAILPTPIEVQRPTTSRSHSSSVSKLTGLHSNPPAETPKSVKSAKSFKPTPRQASNTGARLRSNAPQARDARVDRDSMGDFAEFIRSTGPANSYETILPRSAQSHRGANGVARNVSSGSVPRTGSATSLPRRAESSAGRSRLQARDAIVSRSDSISDLIDFVRSGPQLEKENHRIPRTVAPFRTTMDSDQMSGAVGGKAIDASLPDPRYSQSTSVHSSVTSQSALLNNSSKNKPLPPQNRNDFEEEDMMPKRKTRRVRDPYAIDFSDDEDEYEAAIPRPKAIEEESLADFLRNVPPPPGAIATSVFENVPRPNSSKNIKKKSSTPSLMSRFGRNGSGPQIPPKPRRNGQEIRSQDIKRGVPTPSHTPIAAKYSTTLPSYEPTRGGNYVSQLDSARNKVARRSYEPREAVYSTTRTNDLADFLLRSEPPTSLQTQPQTFLPALQKEEASAFQRMFGRKRVH